MPVTTTLRLFIFVRRQETRRRGDKELGIGRYRRERKTNCKVEFCQRSNNSPFPCLLVSCLLVSSRRLTFFFVLDVGDGIADGDDFLRRPSSGISISNASSKRITSSTTSSESAPKSSMKRAGVVHDTLINRQFVGHNFFDLIGNSSHNF